MQLRLCWTIQYQQTPQGIDQAICRKQDKSEYVSLIEDIHMREWSDVYDTVEIGSLGHFTKDTIEAVKY